MTVSAAFSPELLSPAGDPEKLKYAINYGADAVYLSGVDFGMRSACSNFTDEQLGEAVRFAHEKGKKAYLTVNVLPRPDEIRFLEEYAERISDVPFDAYIVADAGVMGILRKYIRSPQIHISTQMSCSNQYAAAVWHDLGATRVVLARELSLDEIAKIRALAPPSLELEVFIHGSMCMAYSGRCFLSDNMTGRGANRGKCAQPCRWIYKMTELSRPDDPVTVEQYENGSAFFSSKDLCMIEHVPELIRSGVKSFKIEGRVKSAYYAAVTANAYRIAFDRFIADPDGYVFDPALMTELESVSHREYSTGFFFGSPADDPNKVTTEGYIREKGFLATVEAFDEKTGEATLRQRNKVVSFSEAGLLSPGKLTRTLKIGQLYDESGAPIDSAPHPQMIFKFRSDERMSAGDIIRG